LIIGRAAYPVSQVLCKECVGSLSNLNNHMIYVFIITNEAMKNKNWRDKIKIQGGVGDDKLYRKLIAD